MELFDLLVKNFEIYAESSVIDQIKYCRRSGRSIPIQFRRDYVEKDLVKELVATTDDLKDLYSKIPLKYQPTIHSGEIESLAVLLKREDLIFCSCDSATIRVLPLLDISERGISAEKLLANSGLGNPKKLLERHKEEYFKDNLQIGREYKIYELKS